MKNNFYSEDISKLRITTQSLNMNEIMESRGLRLWCWQTQIIIYFWKHENIF